MGIAIDTTISIEDFIIVSTTTTSVITVEGITANSSSVINPCYAVDQINLDLVGIAAIRACSKDNLG